MLSHRATRSPSKKLNLGLSHFVAIFFLVYYIVSPSHFPVVDHQVLFLKLVLLLSLQFLVNVLLHYSTCYSGKPEFRDRAYELCPKSKCDQFLNKHTRTYLSKRWSVCSKLSWIYFSNVTVQKLFWNDSFVILLVPSASFFYLPSKMANNIFWEHIWYSEKMLSNSELSLIHKLKDQNEECHF